MKSKTLWMLGLLLAGCYEDQPDPLPYPPLDARALVGCWRVVRPSIECEVSCFDRSGGFFLARQFEDRKTEIRQDSGTYSVLGNSVMLKKRIKTTLELDATSEPTYRYTILADTLQSIEPIGEFVLARVHPDSFPCGLKPWTLFQKPPGWDTLIIPYDR